MTKTTELEERIEQMVAAEIAALRRAAQGAVERAFAAGSAAAPTVAPSRRQVVRAPGKRRAGSELSALGERFLEVLIQRPGETMVVLSAEIGATPRELHRAVARRHAEAAFDLIEGHEHLGINAFINAVIEHYTGQRFGVPSELAAQTIDRSRIIEVGPDELAAAERMLTDAQRAAIRHLCTPSFPENQGVCRRSGGKVCRRSHR